jgi:hypothetical protein
MCLYQMMICFDILVGRVVCVNTPVSAAPVVEDEKSAAASWCLAVLWLILSLVDQLHLLQLPPRQQCPPLSIAIHDARGDVIFVLRLDRTLQAATPHCRCALRSTVAITTCSGNDVYALSDSHHTTLARSIPHNPRRFKPCGRRRRCRSGRDCSEGMHKTGTEDIANIKIGRRHYKMGCKSYETCHYICLRLGYASQYGLWNITQILRSILLEMMIAYLVEDSYWNTG